MRRKLYKHLVDTDVFNTRTKTRNFTKSNKPKKRD